MKLKSMYHPALISLSLVCTTLASAEEYVVEQKNKSFQMAGEIISAITINAGDSIRFKNEDPFYHNIFSLSELKLFDLGSFPKGESKTVSFENSGKMEVECAIHPEMLMKVTIK